MTRSSPKHPAPKTASSSRDRSAVPSSKEVAAMRVTLCRAATQRVLTEIDALALTTGRAVATGTRPRPELSFKKLNSQLRLLAPYLSPMLRDFSSRINAVVTTSRYEEPPEHPWCLAIDVVLARRDFETALIELIDHQYDLTELPATEGHEKAWSRLSTRRRSAPRAKRTAASLSVGTGRSR